MNIILVYATNSGSTFLVAEQIQLTLLAFGHQVSLREFRHLKFEELFQHDLIIWGSPSWDYQKKEGQPHHDVMQFFEANPDIDFMGRRFALFGLGDKNYAFFTGAVDVMTQFITAHHGEVVSDQLRINQFYFHDQAETISQVEQWLRKIC